MTRHIFLGTLALSLLACGPHTTIRETSAGGGVAPIASGDDVTAPTPEPDAPPARAWLWRISGGDAASPSYVLGTTHASVTLATALPAPFDHQLDTARTLVQEVDFREIEHALVESAQTHARGARPLDRTLGRESWQRLTTEMSALLQPDLLRTLSPSAMTIYLEQVRLAEVEAAAEGREPIAGAASSAELDGFLLDEATRHSVATIALETPVQGLDALAALPAADVLAALHRVIDQADEARQRQSAMRTAYLGFDEAAITQLLSTAWTPAQRDVVLTQRQHAWEAVLVPQIQQGNTFVAVGIEHLVGEGSMIESLRAHGYTVERLGQ